jgi:transposase
MRSNARSKKGLRANVVLPTVRGKSVNLIASLTENGIGHFKILTNTTVNVKTFANYLEELCTKLNESSNNQRVCLIMDNNKVHRRQDLEKVTEKFGFEYKCLSPYSYMLNPIKSAFSKIKKGVRVSLRNNVGGLLSEIVTQECYNIIQCDYYGVISKINKRNEHIKVNLIREIYFNKDMDAIDKNLNSNIKLNRLLETDLIKIFLVDDL